MRESHGPTHSSSSCTQTIKRLLLFLSKPLLLYSDRHLLTCTKGDVPSVYNHRAFCQQIRPPRNIVPTHDAGVSHAIATTIPRHLSRGKYTQVSKGKVHQFFTHISIGLDHMQNSCFLCLSLYALVWMSFLEAHP